MTDMAHGTRFMEKELEALAAARGRGAVDHEGTDDDWGYDDGSAATGTATMSIRLPRSMIAALKAAAENEGVGATVLARRWITERLVGAETAVPMVVDARELLDWVSSHSRPVSPVDGDEDWRAAKAQPVVDIGDADRARELPDSPPRPPAPAERATPTKAATAGKKAKAAR